MNRFPEDLFSPGMTPEQLAARVLEHAFDTRVPSIPVDPFKLMKDYGMIYQFMDFKDLESIYLVPADENDIAVVGINYKRPITRQRFTAAHELCHHIKDRRNEACPKSGKNSIEKYADRFAAELLMPADLFHSVAMEYADGGKVSFDDALIIAERFGVSFQSCVLRLAYRFNMIDEDYTKLNKLYKLLDLNRMLFSHAPFPEESGKTRTQNTLVLGTKFETVDYRDVAMELYKLQEPVEKLVSHSLDWSISDYLLEAVRIHHRITQIHPFRDGNGRCSRALLNWMLKVKGLPPIYIKSSKKENYYKALEMADCKNEYKELLRVVIKELFHTMIQMNSCNGN